MPKADTNSSTTPELSAALKTLYKAGWGAIPPDAHRLALAAPDDIVATKKTFPLFTTEAEFVAAEQEIAERRGQCKLRPHTDAETDELTMRSMGFTLRPDSAVADDARRGRQA